MTDLLEPTSTPNVPGGGDAAVRLRVVLDTSVLIADPNALTAYPGHDLVLPLTVIAKRLGVRAQTVQIHIQRALENAAIKLREFDTVSSEHV